MILLESIVFPCERSVQLKSSLYTRSVMNCSLVATRKGKGTCFVRSLCTQPRCVCRLLCPCILRVPAGSFKEDTKTWFRLRDFMVVKWNCRKEGCFILVANEKGRERKRKRDAMRRCRYAVMKFIARRYWIQNHGYFRDSRELPWTEFRERLQ